MAKPDFVHLHVHSHYSLLDGLGKVDELINKTKDLGMSALALTDHGVMHGAIEFYMAAKKAGIKPIIGEEAYVAPRKMKDKSPGLDTRPYHMVLLAKNFTGYKNLIKLTSAAHLDGYYYKPRIDRDFLSRHAEGIIGTSACLASETSRLIMDKNFAEAERIVREYQEILGPENYYLELQHHPSIPEQQVVNMHIRELAKKVGAPLIITNDTHYVNSDDHVTHDQLVCIQTGKLVSDTNRMLYTSDFSLKSPAEMAAAFPDLPEAVENTVKIASTVDLEIPLGANLLPNFPLPEGETEESLLKKWCEDGLRERYAVVTSEIRSRLEMEFGTVTKMGFAGYFLITADLIRYAKSQGIFVGPGRGSAAGSLMAYVTGITNVDPLKYDLLFERFLDVNRISMPDIDMDFEDTRRGEVIDYVRQKYGDDHVAGIITFGTIMARAAVRDVGRVLGVPYTQVDAIAKAVPAPIQGRHIPLEKSVKDAPELKEIYDHDAEAKQVLDSAMKLEGTIRHASQHACAIVISKEPLDEYVPVQEAQGGDVHQVTQYSMEPIEKLGLLKMDFLGLANLTIMRQAIEIIKAVHGVDIDIYNLPLDDKKTFELFARGDTTGVFQMECLSGDTIVSNTTIKKIYETQSKKRLESVYVDEGKVHKNEILKVLKGPKKQLFNLIAENGWYIKASADHHFLTDNGWRKLGDLKKGDQILLKDKAKHLVYNLCESCGQQISGQKEAKSRFCYRCSAKYYRNPSKSLSRQKITEGKYRYYERGGQPWNVGLTKETSPTLALTGRKISQSLLGKTNIDKFGAARAEEIRQRMSAAMTGKNNHMFGRRPPHRKGGYRSDLGHYVRSNWEADFARILIHQGLAYIYEPKTFPVTLPNGTSTHYTPDFFVPSQNTYYEIKGWLHDADKAKMDAFQQQYPEVNLVLIGATKFAEFALEYRSLVAWECPQIPPGFSYVTVRNIEPAGIEETYDIKMEAPGNNYVANGFVVHNSSGMKRYVRELKPNRFDDITAMVALYRPGPMQWIQSFIDRKNGKEEVEYMHPLAKESFKETYGIPVYQEQVMRMSKDMCGFTGPEADTMRKAIGKKIPKLMKEMKEKFISGAVKNGVKQTKAEEIWAQLEDFAAYCFNKSHAVCYALIAYQTAYLKAHYPECFMAALMTSDQGDTDRLSIEIAESERLGLKVLPPDVNTSFADFGVVKNENAIRFGLAGIKNVGAHVARDIVKARKDGGEFKSLEDFLERCASTLNKKVLENLIKAGALDRFAPRGSLWAGVELITKHAGSFSKQNGANQASLFGEESGAGELTKLTLPAGSEDKKQFLSWEKELLGLYLSDHPFKEYAEKLQGISKPVNEVTLEDANQNVRVAGVVQTVKKITTKASNQMMAFAQIEDLTGMIEVIIFPTIYAELQNLWQSDQMVLIEGKVSDKDGTPKILVDKAWSLATTDLTKLPPMGKARSPRTNHQNRHAESGGFPRSSGEGNPTNGRAPKNFVVELPRSASKETLASLKKILAAHPGQTPVELRVVSTSGTKIVTTPMLVKSSPALTDQVAELLGSRV